MTLYTFELKYNQQASFTEALTATSVQVAWNRIIEGLNSNEANFYALEYIKLLSETPYNE